MRLPPNSTPAGLQISDVKYVAVTHAHIDHCGLALRWQAEGVPVVASELEAQSFLHGRNIIGYQTQYVFDHMRRVGVPEERISGFIEAREQMRRAYRSGDNTGGGVRRERWPGLIRGTPFRADEELSDGAEIRLGDRRVVLVSAPGHTPGNCVFFEPDTGALFSGDQVIPGLNSNPGWHFDISVEPPERFRSLPAFAESLDRIEALEIEYLYPGHREPSDEVAEEIERVRRHHRKRQGQLREMLGEGPTVAIRVTDHDVQVDSPIAASGKRWPRSPVTSTRSWSAARRWRSRPNGLLTIRLS